jgi:hypothetical protein
VEDQREDFVLVDKNLIGLAGEMRVASEFLKKGYEASITFGNSKATDIVVFGMHNRFIRVEVKTSKNQKNFVTGYYPKYTDTLSKHPDIWVFYLPHKQGNSNGDRFFILTHEEVAELQLIVNKGNKTEKGKGCDNIPLSLLENYKEKFEERWGVVGDLLNKLP